MKPISLKMQAFGPYGGVAEVDFERLADVGLFVVSGPTGAGKTSIFDAMTYALFGDLPGDRSGFTDFRSDHAAPAVLCEVVLVFEASDHRWRVTRVPSQERAKKRGEGTAKENASAVLDRWNGSDWEPVVSAVRAVSERCSELIGLNATQFQRVVLLPQGQFQQVLKANSKDRRELLRTLFASSLYLAVEDGLKERAKKAEEVLTNLGRQLGSDRDAAVESLSNAALTLDAPQFAADLDGAGLITIEAALAALDRDQLTMSKAELGNLEVAAAAAEKAKQTGDYQAAQLRRRAELTAEQAVLAAADGVQNASRILLDRATVAKPIVDQAARCDAHRAKVAAQEQHVLSLRADITQRGEDLGFQLAPLDELVPSARRFAAEKGEAARHALTQLSLAESAVKVAENANAEATEAATVLAALLDARQRLQDEQQARAERREALTRTSEALERRQLESADAASRLASRRELEATVTKVAALDLEAEAQQAELNRVAVRADELQVLLAAYDEEARALELRKQAAASLATAAEQFRLRAAAERDVESARANLQRARANNERTLERFELAASPRLAQALVPDEPCMVCGSTVHPAPATQAEGETAITDLAAVEESQAELNKAATDFSEVAARELSLREALGEYADASQEALDAELVAAKEREADSRRAVADFANATEEQNQLTQQKSEVGATLELLVSRRSELHGQQARLEGALGADATADLAELETLVSNAARLVAEAEAAQSKLAALLAETAEGTAAIAANQEAALAKQEAKAKAEQTELLERKRADELRASVTGDQAYHTARAQSASELGAVVDQLDTAQGSLAEAKARLHTMMDALDGLLAQSDFDAVAQAKEATIDDAEEAKIRASFDEWISRTAEVAAALGEIQRLELPVSPPDLDQLAETAATARAGERELRERVTTAELHMSQARDAIERGRAAELAVAEKQAAAQRVKELADVCAGNGPLRRSLESWVLAAHLRDVVALANQHLAPMSSGRYELVVSEGVDDRRSQAGLELVVFDAHSGKARPVASLSGGETFQASLALALGLADVVTANRGGIKIDALFVDEGFGSLDADSLDHAIDVLDGLRSRGALVGVITHVEAMKQALQVGIEVSPNPDGTGSRLVQLGA